MDMTLIGRALRQNRVLVVLGVLAALVAGIFSAYSVSSSGLEPRTEPVYRGSATIILTNPNTSLYAAQIGASAEEGASAVPENANLAQLAMVYAWVVSGDEVRAATEQTVGTFASGESLTAERRTTQPTGDERFGSNASLPIFDIVTTAATELRAQQIAAAATDAFLDYVAQQQDADGIEPGQRVDATVLKTASAELEDGGSSLVSAVLVGLVVLFVAFLLIVYRTNAGQPRGAGRHATEFSTGAEAAPATRAPGGSTASGQDETWGRDEAVLVTSAP